MALRYQPDANNLNNRSAPSGRRLTPLGWRYDAIIDLMLAEPQITLSEIARRLGRGPTWISYIVHSDAFKDVYRQRREAYNARLDDELHTQIKAVAQRSLTVLDKKLEDPAKVSPQLALEASEKMLTMLGYGARAPAVQINQQTNAQTNVVLDPATFAHAQSVVRQLESEVRLDPPLAAALPASHSSSAPHSPPVADADETAFSASLLRELGLEITDVDGTDGDSLAAVAAAPASAPASGPRLSGVGERRPVMGAESESAEEQSSSGGLEIPV